MIRVSVHFARVEGLAPAERDRLLDVVSNDERERLARMRVEGDRDARLVAYVLARRALAERVGLAPAQIPLRADVGGKPVLDVPETPSWRFSLTHTHALAACAVAEGVDVGVDAEDVERHVDVERLARRALMPAELAARARLEGDARRDRFFELWTLREAIAKATGLGLGRTLGKVELDVEGGGVVARFAPGEGDAAEWSFARHRPSERYVLAVAARTPNAEFRFELRDVTA